MRLQKDAKIDLLKGVPLFAGCSKAELQLIASLADELDLGEGATLITRGRARPRVHHRRGRLRAGDAERETASGSRRRRFIGEIALVADVPRTATVTATSPMRLLSPDVPRTAMPSTRVVGERRSVAARRRDPSRDPAHPALRGRSLRRPASRAATAVDRSTNGLVGVGGEAVPDRPAPLPPAGRRRGRGRRPPSRSACEERPCEQPLRDPHLRLDLRERGAPCWRTVRSTTHGTPARAPVGVELSWTVAHPPASAAAGRAQRGRRRRRRACAWCSFRSSLYTGPPPGPRSAGRGTARRDQPRRARGRLDRRGARLLGAPLRAAELRGRSRAMAFVDMGDQFVALSSRGRRRRTASPRRHRRRRQGGRPRRGARRRDRGLAGRRRSTSTTPGATCSRSSTTASAVHEGAGGARRDGPRRAREDRSRARGAPRQGHRRSTPPSARDGWEGGHAAGRMARR